MSVKKILYSIRFLLVSLVTTTLTFAQSNSSVDLEVDWPEFMKRHDFVWTEIPDRWEESPYLGNGNVGTMLYKDGKNNAIRLQLFRLDVQDHRNNTHGWTAYSRPRLMVGSFYLKPVGKIIGADWRFDLWNAELTGKITTDKGSITFTHLVHTDDMVIHTKSQFTGEEAKSQWVWKPGRAETTRKGYPRNEKERKKFIKTYGKIYEKTLKPFIPNPQPIIEKRNGVNVSIQNLLAGGQHAVAWKTENPASQKRNFIVSIEKSYPKKTAAADAVANVQKTAAADYKQWVNTHRSWWHSYYPESFISIPDTRLESFYWHQMYKMACATRSDRPMMDTAGPWIQPTPWPYITWDLNVQLCYWPPCTSNRLHLGQSLVNVISKNRQNLINNVRPVEWQKDSAYIPVVSAQDLIEPRDGDQRYYDCVGNLPWAMHNCWKIYRYSMDESILRETVYPMLKRGINLYRHLLIEGDDGKLHLPVTYSPEVGKASDCNYDLALLKWGCETLLKSAKILKINDPLIPAWKDISNRLVAFPVDTNGFMTGGNRPWNSSHRHYSHLLMAYPLYLVNIDQGAESKALIKKSLEHWISFRGALQGYSYTGSSSISAAIGNGNDSLKYLKGLERFLQPNGLYKEAGPVMETPLSAAQSMHDMILQSWGDTIRVFPATPDAWADISFHDLRTEGAFLVSAVRKKGKTQFIRVKSLAGEPCQIRPNLEGEIHVKGATLKEIKKGVYSLNLKKGEEAILWAGDKTPTFTISTIPADPKKVNSFGLRKSN